MAGHHPVMTWQTILAILGAWLVLGTLFAIVLGKAMRKMDGADTAIHDHADQQAEWRRKDVETIAYRNRNRATEI